MDVMRLSKPHIIIKINWVREKNIIIKIIFYANQISEILHADKWCILADIDWGVVLFTVTKKNRKIKKEKHCERK